jgi:type IV pilus assembly protein PilN
MTPRINLLPHREMKKAQRRRDFIFAVVLAVVAAGGLVFLVGQIIQGYIGGQQQLNQILISENAKLDQQIKEIASLREEIDGLKARQTAVENLQADRNQPVQLLDELVKLVPEGIALRSIKQQELKVTLGGLAQSNERVSELLRNLGNSSPYLEKPELIEIKASTFGQGRDQKKAFEFSLNVLIKRAQKDETKKAGTPSAPAAAAPATK